MTPRSPRLPDLELQVREIHEALLGNLAPGSEPGALDMLRDLRTRVTNMETRLTAATNIEIDQEKRITHLENTSIIRWISGHRKLTILLSALFLMAVIDEFRVPIAIWVHNEWTRMVLP